MFRAAKIDDKKLRCRREAVRCFVSLNISLSHSRSLKVIEMVSFESLDTVFYLYSILSLAVSTQYTNVTGSHPLHDSRGRTYG